MLCTMLCLVLLVSALTGRCRGDNHNSSTSPMLLLPPVPASRRMSAAQVHSLRRQLMRDNYDYEHSSNEGEVNFTANAGDMKFYDQKGGTGHLPLASELAQTNNNAFSTATVQQEHYQQRGQFEQHGQPEQGRRHDQAGEYERHGQHEQDRHQQPGEYEYRVQYEPPRYHKEPGEYEHRVQYEQTRGHEQHSQYDQRDRYEQHGSHKQRGQLKHHGEHDEREQRGQNEQRGSHEQRGQNEQRENSEQQEQLGQFEEQEQSQSIEPKPRAAPSLNHAPDAPPVAVPFTDELAVREFTLDWRDTQRDHVKEYNPFYYNKRRETYDPSNPALTQRKPFSDLRGNFKEQYGQNDAGHDMRAHPKLANNAQEAPDQDYTPDEQEAFDQQGDSASQDDAGSDFSVSMKQPKVYNEFFTRSTTRANRQLYYTPAPVERNAPPHRVHNSLSYHDQNTPLQQSRNVPPPHRNAPPPHRNAPPSHRSSPPPPRKAPDHNISKKDLLYYMDENRLRRRHNDESPDVPNEDQSADDQLPSPQPSPSSNNPAGTRTSPSSPARRAAPTESSAGRELPHTPRARRSFVVTVSAANVTYKLLMLKSRSGRRQDERRILEERGPAGVAIISLDHAPLPAFRLPRARRQYMHAPHFHHYHQRHEPA